MKKAVLIMFILFFTFSIGQNIESLNVKIDSLKLELEKTDKQLRSFQIKRNELNKSISIFKTEKNKLELEQELLNGFSVKITDLGGNLRDTPDISGNTIIKIAPNEEVLVYNWYKKPYFKASYKEKVGYISYSSLENNENLSLIINKGLKKELKKSYPKLDRLTNRYGLITAKRLIDGQFWIGMTTNMTIESLGNPNDINRSTGSWGVHEQWIYENKGLYLYFENGKLKSYQN